MYLWHLIFLLKINSMSIIFEVKLAIIDISNFSKCIHVRIDQIFGRIDRFTVILDTNLERAAISAEFLVVTFEAIIDQSENDWLMRINYVQDVSRFILSFLEVHVLYLLHSFVSIVTFITPCLQHFFKVIVV